MQTENSAVSVSGLDRIDNYIFHAEQIKELNSQKEQENERPFNCWYSYTVAA